LEIHKLFGVADTGICTIKSTSITSYHWIAKMNSHLSCNLKIIVVVLSFAMTFQGIGEGRVQDGKVEVLHDIPQEKKNSIVLEKTEHHVDPWLRLPKQ
jgi:hypothetical protein